MGKGKRTCEICGVKERHCQEKRLFASFPRDKNRCAEWVRIVGSEDLAYLSVEKLNELKHVCEKHFTKRSFNKSKSRLKKKAVPELLLSAAPLSKRIILEFLKINDSQGIQNPATSMSNPGSLRVMTSASLEHDHAMLPTSIQNPATSTSNADSVHVMTSASLEHDYAMLPTSIQNPATSTSNADSVHVMTSASLEHDYAMLPTSIQNPAISTNNADSLRVMTSASLEHDYAMLPTSPQSPAKCNEENLHVMPLSFEDDYAVILTSLQNPAPTTSKADSLHVLPSSPKRNNSKIAPIGTPKAASKRKLDDCIDPRKKKLMKQLQKTKCNLADLRKSAKELEKLSSSDLKEFVKSALKNQNRKPQGKRWTLKNKISALAIFKRSPKTYRYMRHVMPLPSIKTLQTIMKNIPMEPGINPTVISHLKKVATDFQTQDRLCTIAFDEIALKQRLTYDVNNDKVEGFVDIGDERKGDLANHALVFMLQGLGEKIKQPLAYYFVKGTISTQKLSVLIKEVITAINTTGFKVVATVCDQGPTNMGSLNLLKQSNNGGNNYFTLDGEKIFIIFDVPHLFKSIRNNFHKQGVIEMEGKIGKWSHILEAEELNRRLLYITKITPLHVQLKYRAKMKVKYAAQLLSQSMAGNIKLIARNVDFISRENELNETASIVESLNKLFDYTNGPSSSNDVKVGIRENPSEDTDHINVWTEFKRKLQTVKFKNISGTEAKNVKCIEGYIIVTLNSLLDIWEYLKVMEYEYFNLRQVNQDALENLFGIIRQHSPTNRHPTCSGFKAALKSTIVTGMTAPHSKGFNCEKDDKDLLTNFQELLKNQDKPQPRNESVSIEIVAEPPLLHLTDDEIELESDLTDIKDQPIVYISGYIASRLLKHLECSICKECLTIENPEDNPIYELIKLKEWWQNKRCLTYPSVNLCHMIEKAVHIFENEVIPHLHIINICHWTVTLFHAQSNNLITSWLTCNEHAQYVLKFIYTKLALLIIRRQCQRINQMHALKEEHLADANKKGQQYGIAK